MASTPSSLSEEQVFQALKATILVPPQVDQMVSWSHEKTLSAYTGFFCGGGRAGVEAQLWDTGRCIPEPVGVPPT